MKKRSMGESVEHGEDLKGRNFTELGFDPDPADGRFYVNDRGRRVNPDTGEVLTPEEEEEIKRRSEDHFGIGTDFTSSRRYAQRYKFEKTGSGLVHHMLTNPLMGDIAQNIGHGVTNFLHGVGDVVQSLNPVRSNPISPEFQQLLDHRDLILKGLSTTPIDIVNGQIANYAQAYPDRIGGHSIDLLTLGKDALVGSTPYLPGAAAEAYRRNDRTPPRIVQRLDNATRFLPGRKK